MPETKAIFTHFNSFFIKYVCLYYVFLSKWITCIYNKSNIKFYDIYVCHISQENWILKYILLSSYFYAKLGKFRSYDIYIIFIFSFFIVPG